MPDGWLVLYDSECGFCKWLLAGLLRRDRERRLRPVALGSEEADRLLDDLPPELREASWHLISPQGERLSGGDALPALLRLLPAGRGAAAAFGAVPALTRRGYRSVAAHRVGLSRLVPSGWKARAAEYVAERAG